MRRPSRRWSAASCRRATAGGFVGQAIRYFLRQDYQPRELVVVDDGDDAVDDLVPGDERIRYVRLDAPHAARAQAQPGAASSAAATLICHWDDDDWMAPDRLAAQVDALLRQRRATCAASRELLHYRPAGRRCVALPARRATGPGWPAARCSTAAPRGGATRSPPLDVGEDTASSRRLPARPGARHRRRRRSTSRFCTARNTAAKNLADPRWQRRPLDEVGRLLAATGLLRRAAQRPGAAPRRARHRRAGLDHRRGAVLVYDGYGSMGEYLVLGMQRAGADVDSLPLDARPSGADSRELLALLTRARPDADGPVLYFSWPGPALDRFAGTRDLFVHTMWEAAGCPPAGPAR